MVAIPDRLPTVTRRPRKAHNEIVTQRLLNERHAWAIRLGYTKQKWVYFCEQLLKYDYELKLYEAQNTVSKYITVKKGDYFFKVRFSDHKPIQEREINGDCDFFVGRTNLGITTTEDALLAVGKYFYSKGF